MAKGYEHEAGKKEDLSLGNKKNKEHAKNYQHENIEEDLDLGVRREKEYAKGIEEDNLNKGNQEGLDIKISPINNGFTNIEIS